MSSSGYQFENTIGIDIGHADIYGNLIIPSEAWSAVVFAHGAGTSRHNPRHSTVAQAFHRVGLATLVVDLLTPAEERIDQFTAMHRFNIELLTERLLATTDWLASNCSQYEFHIGYFGVSMGAAAAFKAAARRHDILAVVSRGGRPDLAGSQLSQVEAAALLLVGSLDFAAMKANQAAFEQLQRAHHRELRVVAGATHLFEEKGALDEVALFATQWFVRYLGAASSHRSDCPPASRANRDSPSSMRLKR